MTTNLPEVAQADIHGTFNGRPFVNVMHFYKRDGTPLTVANCATIAGILNDVGATNKSFKHLLTRMDSGAVLDTIHVKSLSIATPRESSVASSIAGASAGTDAPPLLAVLIKWTTDTANRRHRGRTYMPGVNTGMFQADSDRLDTTFQGNVATNAADFVLAWASDATFGFVILSQQSRKEDVAVPYAEVSGSSVDPLFCTQRRRRG